MNVGVNAIGKSGQNAERVRRVALVFGLHVTAIAEQARISIALNRRFAQYLGKPSLPHSLPHFHLEKPILCGDESLREEKIMLVGGIDVRDSRVIAVHFYSLLQTTKLQFAVDRRDGFLRTLREIASLGIDERHDHHAEQKDKGASHSGHDYMDLKEQRGDCPTCVDFAIARFRDSRLGPAITKSKSGNREIAAPLTSPDSDGRHTSA